MKQHLLLAGFLLGFCNLSYGGTFTSQASGYWQSSSTWSFLGDADGVPDSDDDVTIIATHTVGLASNALARSLTINTDGTFNINGHTFSLYGNFTNNGTFQYSGNMYFNAAGIISSATPITNTLNFYFQGTGVSIAAGTSITNANALTVYSGVTVTNNGSFNCYGTVNLNGTWINAANSSLTVKKNIGGTGTLTATANPNTVTYDSNNSSTIKNTTYHHLVLSGAGTTTATKSFSAPLTVNGNLTINAPIRLNANGNALTLGGNWINNSNRTHLVPTVIFNGTGTQTIARWTSTEVFTDVTLSGTGTVQLGSGISGYTGSTTINGTFTFSSGTLNVSTFTLTLNSTVSHTAGTLTSSSTGTVIYNQSTAGQAVMVGNYGNLTFSNFAKVLPASGTIGIAGTFTPGSGSGHTITGSTIEFNGTAAQTMSFTFNFYNFTANNAAGISIPGGTYSVLNVLAVSAGILDNTGGTFTLLSDATSTARIAPITAAGADIMGPFIIQRFITARTANWVDISSPVQNTTLSDWDNEIYMSGVNGPDGNACCPIYRSVYTYNEPTAAYVAVTDAATTTLTPGVGFELCLGDNLNTWSAKAINTIGKPNTNTQTISVTNNGDGWNLVGNPFASFIAWDNITMTNIDPSAYYIFDNATGTYAAFGPGTSIPHTQGFWVLATGAPSMSIPESAKTNSTASTFLRTSGNTWFTLKLSNMQNLYSHKTHIRIGADATDFPFLKSPVEEAPSITFAGAKDLGVKAISGIEESVSLPLNVKAGVNGIYTIEASGLDYLEDYTCAILEDTKTGEKIDLDKQGLYAFETTTDSDPARFILHLSKGDSPCRDLRLTPNEGTTASAHVINSSEGVFVQFNSESDEQVTISVTNVLGQEIMKNIQVSTAGKQVKLDLPAGLSGIYLVNIRFAYKNITEKIFRSAN